MIHDAIAPECDLIIFGAKGDLTRRKLLPSLYRLDKQGYLHPKSRIIGVGRAKWQADEYVNVVKEALETFLDEKLDEETWHRFKTRFDFCNLDVTNTNGFSALTKKITSHDRTIIYYFAMPPSSFGAICEGLGAVKLNTPNSRVVMEKPLGHDLESSIQINNSVAKFFDESQTYRIDHYLGKESVLNLMALRFANPLFTSIWDNKSIDHVQITIAEEVGIEGRWGYFDNAGQMRDMVQNHLLQILTMIAMAPPAELSSNNIRDEKVKVLQALRPITHDNVRENTVRGQYTAGFSNNKQVVGYLQEDGANKQSNTETFVAIKMNIDNWRWAGVPFYVRTGKRLNTKYSEVVIYLKPQVLNLFSSSYSELPPNKLTIRLQPDEGVDIQILNKIPGLEHKHRLQTTKLDLCFSKTFSEPFVDAYDRLLIEVMRGMQTLFVHRDEVEAAWRWVDSIINAWEVDGDAPKPYSAGSSGPNAAIALITKDGRSWNEPNECEC